MYNEKTPAAKQKNVFYLNPVFFKCELYPEFNSVVGTMFSFQFKCFKIEAFFIKDIYFLNVFINNTFLSAVLAVKYLYNTLYCLFYFSP